MKEVLFLLKDNQNHNETVAPNTAFINELRQKLPDFFTANKYDEDGNLVEEGKFDPAKFNKALEERNIDELTNGNQLNFIGKDYAKKQAGERSATAIVPDVEHNSLPENGNSKNLFFTGDNLEALRHLQNNYKNTIDVIYIDPPYNTGSDGFVYPDKFEYSDTALKNMFGLNDTELQKLKSIQGKATHSAWLTFMYPRVWLAKRLLSENGVIFVSIDDNEQANLKILMDEIFGENSFVTQFLWTKTSTPPSLSLKVRKTVEYVLCYEKKANNDKFFGSLLDNGDAPLLNTGNSNKELVFPVGSIRFNFLENGIIKSGNYERTEVINDFLVKDGINSQPVILKAPFKWNQGTLDEEINSGTYFLAKTNKLSIRFQRIDNESFKTPNNSLTKELNKKSNDVLTNEAAVAELEKLNMKGYFDYPKPTSLIKYLINMKSFEKKDCIVMDFFAGSSTTADAVMQLNTEDKGNRQYIMMQLPEQTFSEKSDGTRVARKGSEAAYNAGYMSIDEISRERIKRASKMIQEEAGLELPKNFDGGFKHYHVVSPSQPTLDDLDSFDVQSGLFKDNTGQLIALSESDFDDMIKPFSSEGLGVGGNASGEETILTTWLVSDGYKFGVQCEKLVFEGYKAIYVDNTRLYLINENWGTKQTRELLNQIGTNKLPMQTVVIYGYSFGLETIRELEIGLKQLDMKVNLVKRY